MKHLSWYCCYLLTSLFEGHIKLHLVFLRLAWSILYAKAYFFAIVCREIFVYCGLISIIQPDFAMCTLVLLLSGMQFLGYIAYKLFRLLLRQVACPSVCLSICP